MEQIAQLKAMRDAAKARLMASPDWKLMVSLDALIPDLEKAFGIVSDATSEDEGEGSGDEEPAPGSAASNEGAAGEEPSGEPAAGDEPAVAETPALEAMSEVEGALPDAPEPIEADIAAEAGTDLEIVEETVIESVTVFGEEPEGASGERESYAAAAGEAGTEAAELSEFPELEQALEGLVSNGHVREETLPEAEAADAAEPAREAEPAFSTESEEDAVSRALDELSQDLADATREETPRPSVFTFRN